MNDHRKLVEDCINKRADNHAELLKKLDKTCERIAKNEPKVILTINQAKEIALKLMSNDEFFFRQTGEFDYDTEALWQCLTDKIEQAEGKK